MIADVEVLRLHDAETLKQWRRHFCEQLTIALVMIDSMLEE